MGNPNIQDTPWLTEPNTPPLLLNWDQIAYTDASISKHKTQEGTITNQGAGIYIPYKNSIHGINPSLNTMPSNINSAELVGIWGALQLGHTHIATDNASSIYQF
jgi:hypothetical protein